MKYLIVFLISTLSFFTEAKAQLKVVFINPGFESTNDSGDFWPNVNRFMHAAANDLNIELISLHAERNHILMKQLVKQAVKIAPDYLILVNEKDMLPHMLAQLEQADIDVFLLLNKFSQQQRDNLPDVQANTIVGCLSPNNQEVGEQLAIELIKRVDKNDGATIKMFALLGDYTTPAAIEREFGLKKALARYSNVELIDSSVANWSEQEAYEKTYGVFSKRSADIVWAANDAMAFGAIAALTALKKKNEVQVGGINWDIHAKQYQADVSFGGHVTLGAKALLMLHDKHFFPNRAQSMSQRVGIFEPNYSQVNKPFLELLRNKHYDSIDFSQFSVGSEKPLTFNLENLMSSTRR